MQSKLTYLLNARKYSNLKCAKSASNNRLHGFTLVEILVVLAIIGVLLLIALPKFDSLFSQAYSIEAQNQLSYLQGLQNNFYTRKFSYADDFNKVGFDAPRLLGEEGGTARYTYEIVRAAKSDFTARATAIEDFDGDGVLNVWEIRKDGPPEEVMPD